MASASNDRQLQHLIMADMRRAITKAQREMLSDMRDATVGFYTNTTPSVYERTGALAETPKVTDVEVSDTPIGGEAKFTAYFDTSHQYATGKEPSMELVLEHANRGGNMTEPERMRAVVGNSGFIDSAQEEMAETFDRVMRDHFRKT